jgi:integrase
LASNDKRKILSELSKIEKFNTLKIDGQMISNILRFSCFFGLKKGEIINLNVGDVTEKAGVVPETIRIGGKKFPVTDEIKNLIQDHYQFLWEKGHKRYRSSPLFPTKKHKCHNGRTLIRHMGMALRNSDLSSLNLEDFRKIGINLIYTECRSEGIDENLCRGKTKKFAGLTDDRQLKKVLKDARSLLDRIIGPDQDPYQKYLYSIRHTLELLEYASNHYKDSLIEKIKFLKKAIQDDSGLSESQKDDLFSKIPPIVD